MANCVLCGCKLPAFTIGAVSDTCRACQKTEAGQAPEAALGGGRPTLLSLRKVTPATGAIIGLNALVLAAMTISTNGKALLAPSNSVLLRWGADWGPATFASEPWRAFTSMWVHAGALHLFLNMWCLDQYGRITERLFGWRFYLAIYALAGFCGSIASLAWHPNTVSVGASAAVFGVVGALVFPFSRGRLPIPPQALKAASKSLLAFVGYNLLIGMVVPAIDNAAHVGGLLGGFTLGAMATKDAVGGKGRLLRGTVVAVLIVISLFFVVRRFRVAATFGAQAAEMLEAGRTEEAIALATAAVAHDDRDAFAHAVLGWRYLNKNDNERAVEEFEKAVSIEPDYEYALARLGSAYDGLDRSSDAARVLERAVKLDEKDSEAWADLGIAYVGMGRMEEAVKALRTALQVDPGRAPVHDALGIMLQRTGQIDPAIESFRRAVRLEPENKEFTVHLADALEAKGLRDEAEKVRDKVGLPK
jgi:membrane associated rhomboid family serine protease/Flp pilus assembly protein TadD